MFNAPGHARHQMAILHEPTGTMLAGDGVGARVAGGGLHPTTPPSEFDPLTGIETLNLLETIGPTRLYVSHFGELPDPLAGIEQARGQLETIVAVATEHWKGEGRRSAVAAAVRSALPITDACRTPEAKRIWEWLGWEPANIDGVIDWLARGEAVPPG